MAGIVANIFRNLARKGRGLVEYLGMSKEDLAEKARMQEWKELLDSFSGSLMVQFNSRAAMETGLEKIRAMPDVEGAGPLFNDTAAVFAHRKEMLDQLTVDIAVNKDVIRVYRPMPQPK